jgi:hypothetical protein
MLKGDVVDKIIQFESGEMDDQETINFFQELIDDGLVWNLQGMYGRMATALIEAGHCTAKYEV